MTLGDMGADEQALSLLTDPERLAQFGQQARESVLSLDWHQCCERFESAMLQLIQEKASARREPTNAPSGGIKGVRESTIKSASKSRMRVADESSVRTKE